MAGPAKRRNTCLYAIPTMLAFAFCLTSEAQKKPAADSQSTQQPANSQAEQKHEKDDPRARAEYLEKRRSGGKPVPRGARLRAMQEQHQMMLNEGRAFWEKRSADSTATTTTERTGTVPETGAAAPERSGAVPAVSASQWVFIGPQPTNPSTPSGGAHVSGRVTALAVDPGDNTGNTVYLGAAQGGVWKTTNGGTSWSPLTDNQASLAIGSIVIDPQVNGGGFHTVYVGTGEENFGADNYYGVGILKSADGGSTWSLADNTAFTPGVTEPECNTNAMDTFIQGIGGGCGGLRIGSLAMANGALLAAVDGGFSNSGGLYRSTNGGQNWSLVNGIAQESSSRYTADSVVFVNSTTAYAGIRTNEPQQGSPVVPQGVYKSTDGGANWTQWNGGIPNVGLTARVNVTAATDGTVYAAFETRSSSTLAGLFKLAPGATNWTQLTVPHDFCGGDGTGQCFYDMLVSVNPANSSMLFIGGSGFPNTQFLYHSVDGGATWFQDTTNIHADQHAGAFTSGGTFYIGNDGGAYKTSGISTSAVTWTELNGSATGPLGITQFYGYFAIDPSNSQRAYGGTQDNGTQQFANDTQWNEVTCGDGAGAVIDSNTGRVFANCNDIDVRESADGSPGSFGSQHQADSNITQGDPHAFIPPMVGDHLNPVHLYFGTNKIYQATSAVSPQWAVISGMNPVTGGNAVTNIDVSNDGTTLYSVSEDGKVFKGTNLLGTPAFTDVTSSGFQSGNYITAVRISPSDNNTAYISLSGFGAGNHIYKSTGGIWNNISGNLPNTPVNDLVIDPDIPGKLYAATDIGVFSATDAGTSTNWTTLQTMLPKIAVLGLRLHRGSRILRAATHGRGMWDLYVPACTPGGPCLTVAPNSVDFGTLAVGATSGTQTITVTNTGGSALTVNGVTLAGSDFVQNNNCGTVAPSAACTISLTFTPRAGLTRTGSVTIFSNSAGSPATVALTGVGLVIPVNDDVNSPITITSLPFTATVITNGATTLASDPIPSDTNCVGVYNPPDPLGYATSANYNHHSIWFYYTPQTSGTVDLDTIQSTGIDTVLSVWTGSPGSFTSVACNDDVNPGVVVQSQITNLTVNVGITYKIMVTGYYANDFGAVTFHMAQSTGSGATSAPFTLSAASLNFTALLLRPVAQTVTITNNSGVSKTVSSVSVSGDYSTTHNCGALGIGASCTETITLTPTLVGQRNSVLTIQDNASGSPQTVPLNGFAFNFNLANPRPHRSARNGGVAQGQRQQFQVALNTSTGGATIPVTLSCGDVPPGATCTVAPSQVSAGDGSTPVIVTLQTSAARQGPAGSYRTRRLGGGTPVGDYNLKVTARVGDAETTTLVPVTVIAPAPASRLSKR